MATQALITLPAPTDEHNPTLDFLLMQAAMISYDTFSPAAQKGFIPVETAVQPPPPPDSPDAVILERYHSWQVKVIDSKHDALTTRAIIMKNPQGQAIVSFRGTHNVQDFLACDARCELVPFPYNGKHGLVHKGFLEEMQAVREQLITELSKDNIKQIYFGSHSMGAAVQELFVASLPEKIQNKVCAAHGYGEPPTGNQGFYQDYRMPHHHITNLKGDPVPISLLFAGYGVPPDQKWIDKNGNPVAPPPIDSPTHSPAAHKSHGIFATMVRYVTGGVAQIFTVVEAAVTEIKEIPAIPQTHMPICYVTATENGEHLHQNHIASAMDKVHAQIPDLFHHPKLENAIRTQVEYPPEQGAHHGKDSHGTSLPAA